MKMTVQSPAKINLFLEITGKRNDGYHLINTVMQAVSLYDDITVSVDPDGRDVSLSCNRNEIPCDSSNTAYKAALRFFEYTGIPQPGLNIKIKKRIPFGAGMAGGSADAAAVIYCLNELMSAGLDTAQMAEIGEQVGADVPFCIYGGTMSAGGIGTILNPLPDMPDCYIVIVMPEFRISTKEAYEKSDSIGYESLRNMDDTVNAVCAGNISALGKSLYNKFELVADAEEINDIKSTMNKSGALGALMTGSGSAVFGIFDSKDSADDCETALKDKYSGIYSVEPVRTGPIPLTHLSQIFS